MAQDLLELSSEYFRSKYMRRNNSRLSLAGVVVSIKDNELRQITVDSEYALQKIAVECAENAKIRIQDNLKKSWTNMLNRPYSDGDIVDSGATLESVYVVYPGSQKVQTKFRRLNTRKQSEEALSPKSYKDFLRATKGASSKLPRLGNHSKDFHPITRRRLTDNAHRGYSAPETMQQSFMDEPINEMLRVNRKNLYVGIAVGTPWAILQSEGFHAKGHYVPPRDFFAPEIYAMQTEFASKSGNLERYMTKKI